MLVQSLGVFREDFVSSLPFSSGRGVEENEREKRLEESLGSAKRVAAGPLVGPRGRVGETKFEASRPIIGPKDAINQHEMGSG